MKNLRANTQFQIEKSVTSPSPLRAISIDLHVQVRGLDVVLADSGRQTPGSRKQAGLSSVSHPRDCFFVSRQHTHRAHTPSATTTGYLAHVSTLMLSTQTVRAHSVVTLHRHTAACAVHHSSAPSTTTTTARAHHPHTPQRRCVCTAPQLAHHGTACVVCAVVVACAHCAEQLTHSSAVVVSLRQCSDCSSCAVVHLCTGWPIK